MVVLKILHTIFIHDLPYKKKKKLKNCIDPWIEIIYHLMVY